MKESVYIGAFLFVLAILWWYKDKIDEGSND
jgi:hypothetical protein